MDAACPEQVAFFCAKFFFEQAKNEVVKKSSLTNS